MITFKNQTITRLRGHRIRERGNDVLVWVNPDAADIKHCRVQPMAGEEIHLSGARNEGGRAREAVERKVKVFAPYSADITEHDRFTFDGTTYDVEGQINRYVSPGMLPHSEFVGRWIDG